MKDFPFIIFIIYFGLFCTIFVMNYKVEEFKHSSLVLSITETAKVAAVQSLDSSVRVEPGMADVTDEVFETNFTRRFNESVNVKLQDPVFTFDYLRANDGSLMAVRVIVAEGGSEYQATYLTDIGNRR